MKGIILIWNMGIFRFIWDAIWINCRTGELANQRYWFLIRFVYKEGRNSGSCIWATFNLNRRFQTEK